MTATRVVIRTDALIARIQAKKAEAIKAHEARTSKATKQADTWVDRVLTAVIELEHKIDGGHVPEGHTVYNKRSGKYDQYAITVCVKGGGPGDKTDDLDTRQFDRDIALLEMSAKDTISVSADTDLGRRYL